MKDASTGLDGSMAGAFTQSMCFERNLKAVSTRQWIVVVQSLPVTVSRGPGLGTFTLADGYSLGDMRQVTIIPSPTAAAFWRRQNYYLREHRQYCRASVFGGDLGFGQNATRNIPVDKTGSTFVRLFFRVLGVCELVGWGSEGELVLDQTKAINTSMGNIYSLRSNSFRLTNQNYTIRRKFFSVPDTLFTTTEGLILNRTQEPSPMNHAGTFLIDRIVAVSAQLGTDESFSATLEFTNTYQAGIGYNFFNPGDPPNGDYPGTLFSGEPGGFSSIFNSGGTVTWGNPKATNPTALSQNLPHGPNLMPNNGFNVADPSAPGGVRRVPVNLTNALEVVYLGARAESALRAEETIDIRTPELLNEF